MSLAEYREQLLRMLEARFAPNGFGLRRGTQSLVLERDDVRFVIHLGFISHTTDFDVTVDVAVRHHPVEERLAATRTHLNRREQRETATVGVELGNWDGRGQQRWTVSSRDDLDDVARDIEARIRSIGLPFLNRFSSLAEIQRVLVRGDQEARLICPLENVRRSVLAATEAILDETPA